MIDKNLRSGVASAHLPFMAYCWNGIDDFTIGFHTERICARIDKAMKDYRNGKSSYVFIAIHPRSGKQISHDTPVMTDKGFKNHGDLLPGDYVYSPTGQKIKVQAISKEMMQDVRVHFSDHTYIDCHEDHEWVVIDRTKHKQRIVETVDFFNGLQCSNNNKTKNKMTYRFHLPEINSVETSAVLNNTEIDPYILGVWLGDGTASQATISNPYFDTEHIIEMERRGAKYGNVWRHKTTGVYYRNILEMVPQLKKLNLIKNKHIPDKYFSLPPESRRDLLCGLIDTDGYIDKNGRVIFSTIYEHLAVQFRTLVSSLGYTALLSKEEIRERNRTDKYAHIKDNYPIYKVTFTPNDGSKFAYLSRKQINIKTGIQRKRAIIKVERIKSKLGRCIQVEGGVYLVGKTFIPTHNSEIVSKFLPPHFLGEFPDHNILSVTYNLEQAYTFSSGALNVVKSNEYQDIYPDIKLTSHGVKKWSVRHKDKKTDGTVTACSLLAGLAGKGAHLAILDDYLKSREQAESERIRDKLWSAFSDDFFTRLAPTRIVIVLATPWHVDDIRGRVKKKMEEDNKFPKFEFIDFPARKADYVSTDGKTYSGEFLFGERYDEEWYEQMYAILGRYSSASLMDCNPTIRGGNILSTSKIQYHDTIDDFPTRIKYARIWDLGHGVVKKGKTKPDPTGGTLLGFRKIGYNAYLRRPILEMWVKDYQEFRCSSPVRDERIIEQIIIDGGPVDLVLEATTDSIDTVNQVEEKIRAIKRVYKLTVSKKKSVRVSPLEGVFEAGRVHILKADWNRRWLQGVEEFDGSESTHDEMIDNMSSGYEHLVLGRTSQLTARH